MEKSASTRYMTRAEDLLSAMSDEEVKPETKTPHKAHWQQIFMACCCLLVIAAATKGFLYLDTEISMVQSDVGSTVKDLNTLQAEVTAARTKEEIAAATAEIEDLKATNTRLRTEVEQIREAFEASKAKKKNVVSAQHKR
jgi:septal ring factor EnvC (AmiA/AmiB activator)